MKNLFPLLFITLWCISCTKDEPNVPSDLSPGIDWITISSNSYVIPLNGTGAGILSATTNLGDDITSSTTFFANDVQLDHNKFSPAETGPYIIIGKYKDLTSAPLDIKVESPLNKKVLIESFTSRTCGFCPWIGTRLDSLDHENKNVISYSIHGQDELEANESYPLQQLLEVYARPSVRINRGYVRNFDAPIEIKELIDSVQYFLSTQPKVELSIQSEIHEQTLSAHVFCKYYESIRENIFLTFLMVEDSVITQDQYNYFNGYSWTYCPFATLPFYLHDYKNHNVLRSVLTDTKGDPIVKAPFEYGVEQEIGSFSMTIPSGVDLHHAKFIAIIHNEQHGIEISTVLNAQIVNAGDQINFNE